MAYQCQQYRQATRTLPSLMPRLPKRFQTIPKRIPHPMEILQYDTVGKNPSVYHWTSRVLRLDRTLSLIYSWDRAYSI